MSDAQKWKEKFVAAQEIMKDAIPEHNAQLQDSSKLFMYSPFMPVGFSVDVLSFRDCST